MNFFTWYTLMSKLKSAINSSGRMIDRATKWRAGYKGGIALLSQLEFWEHLI